MTNRSTVHLRHEAEALKLNSLTISQTRAFLNLLKLLIEAANTSGSGQQLETSRIAILSGHKGTGKSSVMMTLKSAISSKDPIKTESDNNPADEKASLLREIATILNPSEGALPIHWLAPLSMDPWPDGSNFLGSVLARLNDSIGELADRSERTGKFDRDGTQTTNSARQWFQSLRSEAVTAQEGNLKEVASEMPPQQYAIQINETEDHRARLKSDLVSILSSVINPNSAGGSPNRHLKHDNGIFVVVIDDVDLRPAQAAKALKLAHTLANRRLFFLFLGDIEALDTMLFYEVQGEFFTLMEHPPQGAELIDIEARSNEIASSVVRKLIPWNQRIRIADMTINESLKYSMTTGLSSDENSDVGDLEDELDKLMYYRNKLHSIDQKFVPPATQHHLDRGGSKHNKPKKKRSRAERARTFRYLDFFKALGAMPKDATALDGSFNKSKIFYDGANTLNVAPRHVGDFYHAVEAVNSETAAHYQDDSENLEEDDDIIRFERETAYQLDDMIDALLRTFKSFVNEDGDLTIPVQHYLKELLKQHTLWEMNASRISSRPVVGDGFALSHDVHSDRVQKVLGVKPNFNISKVLHYELDCVRTDNNNAVTLNHRSRPAFKILHDMLKFSGRGVVVHPIETKESDEAHMSTRWTISEHDELLVPWKVCDWPTFWHQDYFTFLWNRFFDNFSKLQREPSTSDSTEIKKFLVHAWIHVTFATLNTQPGMVGHEHPNYDPIKVLDQLITKSDAYWSMNDQLIFDPDQGESEASELGSEEISSSLLVQFNLILARLVKRICDGQENEFNRVIQTKICEVICLFTPEIGVYSSDSRPDVVYFDAPQDVLFSEILQTLSNFERQPEKEIHSLFASDPSATQKANNQKTAEKIKSIIQDIWAEVAEIRLHRMADHIGNPLVFTLLRYPFTELHKETGEPNNHLYLRDGSFDIGTSGQLPKEVDGEKTPLGSPSKPQQKVALLDWCSFCLPTAANRIGLEFCSLKLFGDFERQYISEEWGSRMARLKSDNQ